MTTNHHDANADGRKSSQSFANHDSTSDLVLDKPWMLHPRVSLRPEPFGALAYHYDNRKLQFLRSPDLVDLVASLADFESPRDAFNSQGIDPARWPSFAKALRSLADSKFIQPASRAAT